MGNEELSTILEKESDEFIKSSVKDIVPFPSEFEDTFESDSELMTSHYPMRTFRKKMLISTRYEEYISSDVNPLFDEVFENIENKDSYYSNLIEPDLLVTPLSDANEDECFDPGDDVDKIEFLRHLDPSIHKLSVAFILEGFTNKPPLEDNDDLFDLESKENEWKKILYDAPIDNLMIEDNVFDPRNPEKFFSPTYMILPFKDQDKVFDLGIHEKFFLQLM
nr:hypothetical protein [Tanacetum cinerariifolium]